MTCAQQMRSLMACPFLTRTTANKQMSMRFLLAHAQHLEVVPQRMLQHLQASALLLQMLRVGRHTEAYIPIGLPRGLEHASNDGVAMLGRERIVHSLALAFSTQTKRTHGPRNRGRMRGADAR